MNAKRILILSFLLFTTFNSLNSMNIYKNDEHGISFEYPDEVIFDELNKYSEEFRKYYLVAKYSDELKDINEKYILNVDIITIKEFFQYRSLKLKEKDLNEENILKIFNKNKSNNKNNNGLIINDGLIIYNGRIIGYKSLGFLEINSDEVNRYYVWFYMVKGEYVISIHLWYYDLLTQIPPKYPDYFKKDETSNEWAFKWNEEKPGIVDKFFNLAITHSNKAAPELVKLFDRCH